MLKILSRFGKALVVLTSGLFFAFLIQGVWAYIGPDCNPYDTTCTTYPEFYSLTVGGVPGTGENTVRVKNDMVVVGTLFTDGIDDLDFGADIQFLNDFEAAQFGHFYIKELNCMACNSSVADGDSSKTLMNSQLVACNAGDVLLGCSGWVDSTLKRSYGSDIYQATDGIYYCQTLSSGTPMTGQAFCFSPDFSSTSGI